MQGVGGGGGNWNNSSANPWAFPQQVPQPLMQNIVTRPGLLQQPQPPLPTNQLSPFVQAVNRPNTQQTPVLQQQQHYQPYAQNTGMQQQPMPNNYPFMQMQSHINQAQQQFLNTLNPGLISQSQPAQGQQQFQQPIQSFLQNFSSQQTYPQQQQQQQQSFGQPQQQQQNFLQQQQQAFHEQWQSQWNQSQGNQQQCMPPAANNLNLNQSGFANSGTIRPSLSNVKMPMVESQKPPLPREPPPPLPVVSSSAAAISQPPPPPLPTAATARNIHINPPLPPPPPASKSDNKRDVGKIISTNLPGLMDIITGSSKKKKDENRIPGLDTDLLSSPAKKTNHDPSEEDDVELVDLAEDEGTKSNEVSTGNQNEKQLNSGGVGIGQSNSSDSATAAVIGFTTQANSFSQQSRFEPAAAKTYIETTGSLLPSQIQSAVTHLPSHNTSQQSTFNAEAEPSPVIPEGTDESTQADGKITLKAFDNKFRDWEKQFNDWKTSSSKHPDKKAYADYLAQWEAWREQLIEQRRCIIATVAKEREANVNNTQNTTQGNASMNSGSGSMNKDLTFQQPHHMQQNSAVNSSIASNSNVNAVSVPQAFHQAQNSLLGRNQNQIQGTQSQPEPQPNSASTSSTTYETRDLSKLIQNPFAVTGGPVTPEQRQFFQHQQNFGNAPQPFRGRGGSGGPRPRQPFGGLRAALQQPLLEQPHQVSRNTFGQRQQRPPIPSLLKPLLPQPPSPTERVSRQPHRNLSGDFENDRSGGEKFQDDSFQHPNQPNANPFEFPQFNRGMNQNIPRPQQTRMPRPQQTRMPMPHPYQNRPMAQSMLRPSGAPPMNRFQPPPTHEPEFDDRFGYPDRRREDYEEKAELSFDTGHPFSKRPPPDEHEFNIRPPVADEPEFQFVRRNRGPVDFETPTPVTIDYGHGSEMEESPLISRSRSLVKEFQDTLFKPRVTEPPQAQAAVGDDEGGVVLDYGHGSTEPVAVIARANEQEQDDEFENYHDRYNHNPPEPESHHGPSPYPPYHPRGRGFPGRRPFRGGRGMPPMRGGFPRPPFSHPNHPYADYEDEHWEEDSRAEPRRGGPPRFPPPEVEVVEENIDRPQRPVFPIGDYHRPVRIAPPHPPAEEEITIRQAPPRDLEPISPEGSPRSRSYSRERVRRNNDRSISREKDRSSPPGRRRRDSPVRRDRRPRSRSRSPREYRDRRGVAGRGRQQSSPPPSSSSSESVLVEDILNNPGRKKRPSKIVIILRGLPGSGKTHVAKLIKDRETDLGDSTPRILSLDDYFMIDDTKTIRDPITGKEIKEKVSTYEFDPGMETRYRDELFKTFRKTVENGLYRFIIVDCVNEKFRHFQEMTNYAKAKRFQVYVVEMEGKAEECAKKNIHHKTLEDIREIEKNWEKTPSYLQKLDVRTLLQDEAIQHVEMEDVSDTEDLLQGKKDIEVIELEDEEDENPWATSKWETSEDKLNKLDGLARKRKNADEEKKQAKSMETWLQTHLPDDYLFQPETQPGKKRVRWADIEARREQERAREIGFVVGQTDWSQMTDPSFASSALTRTKYF